MYGKDGALMSGPKKSNSRYSENWIPARAISNGMIELDNKYKVTGVKIRPRNIFILDQMTQDNVLISLKNFYNMIDFEFWLICADKPVDISGYQAQLQLLYNQTQSPVVRKLVSQDINKAEDFVLDNVTDTEYYILFKEKNLDTIQKRIRTLISGLADCGLEASQTSNNDLRVILDNFLNGGRTTEFRTVIS